MAGVNFNWFGRRPTPIQTTLYDVLLVAPFQWWAVSSMLAFAVLVVLWVSKTIWRLAQWVLRARSHDKNVRAPIESQARRRLLRHTATAAVAAPFVAEGYGLLYGRLNLETTRNRIHLPRLPTPFDGLRIAQLSDIHIGPFMTADEIRKYVRIANDLKPDLFVLTGDFITWDAATQQPVVDALSGLRAPLGVFACLGNHETWSNTEDSISRLFEEAKVRVLRQACALISVGREELNLIGIDYVRARPGQSNTPPGPSAVSTTWCFRAE
jgi:hypothetical protein